MVICKEGDGKERAGGEIVHVPRMKSQLSIASEVSSRSFHPFPAQQVPSITHFSYLNCPVWVVGLVVWVVELSDIRMLEGISSTYALVGVEVQTLRHQIQRLSGRAGENLVQRYLPRGWNGFEHCPGERRFDGLDVLRWRFPGAFHDFLKLSSPVLGADYETRNNSSDVEKDYGLFQSCQELKSSA